MSLDTELTPGGEAEGLARDLVRVVQEARKKDGLEVTDRIHLRLDLPESLSEAVQAHETHLRFQVLADGELWPCRRRPC